MESLLGSQTISLFGLNISLYGLIISIGMLLGIVVACLICKKKDLDFTMPLDLALFALPCAIVGARLYYCLFNGVDRFVQIFEIWNGGMAIYGGVIGGFLGILLCCKIKKYSLMQACDIAAPCLILGQSIGRIGCYFAGCCYGVETTNPALQVFPLSVLIDGHWHLATFFYESLLDLIGFFILILITLKSKRAGNVTAGYFVTYGLIRVVLEQFRDPSESLMLGATGIKVSQLLSFILVIIGIIIFVINFKLKNKEAKTNG